MPTASPVMQKSSELRSPSFPHISKEPLVNFSSMGIKNPLGCSLLSPSISTSFSRQLISTLVSLCFCSLEARSRFMHFQQLMLYLQELLENCCFMTFCFPVACSSYRINHCFQLHLISCSVRHLIFSQ